MGYPVQTYLGNPLDRSRCEDIYYFDPRCPVRISKYLYAGKSSSDKIYTVKQAKRNI